MRIAAIAIILAAGSATSSLWAQRNAVSPSGFGRVMFPGGGPAGAYSGASSPNAFGNVLFPGTGAPAAINSLNGFPGGGLPVAPAVQHNNHGSSAIVPYPVFVGGGYYPYSAPLAYGSLGIGQAWPTPGQPGFSGSNYVQPANVQPTQSSAPSQDQSPVVVINQYFRPDASAPTTQTSNVSATPESLAAQPQSQSATLSADMQNIFLIAMKDHMIYAANSYWIEDNTLNYITVQGTENSVSMDLVDRDLSRRLNRDRKVAFGLPQ